MFHNFCDFLNLSKALITERQVKFLQTEKKKPTSKICLKFPLFCQWNHAFFFIMMHIGIEHL